MVSLAALTALTFSTLPGERLPITQLPPARLVTGVCLYHYPVITSSEAAQAHCDLGAGFYQSYVYRESARQYETALKHDPDCALAWLGLANALQKWTPRPRTPALLALTGSLVTPKLPDGIAKPKDYALAEARRLMDTAGSRGQLLIRAKLEELGKVSNISRNEWRSRAAGTLDELLTLHDDDQEAWFARAALAEGKFGKVPFYKSLLKVNPLHPGANHELVHFYESIRRPALGWPYAEAYIASSPGVPHAFHMQAHLAMRTGKWGRTTDWSVKAMQLEDQYHIQAGMNPREDDQFRHHLDVLTKALVHDGRFAELDAVRTKAERIDLSFRNEWFRAALMRGDWSAAEAIVTDTRRADKGLAAYFGALLALERGDLARAEAEADTLRSAGRKGKLGELRQWEVRGRLAAARGEAQAGIDLIRRAVAKSDGDYAHDAWGGGAYFYEVWGKTALTAGLNAEAEEGFLEALAHDHGSIQAALGLQILAERDGRAREASAYRALAQRIWNRAAPSDLDRLYRRLAESSAEVDVTTTP